MLLFPLHRTTESEGGSAEPLSLLTPVTAKGTQFDHGARKPDPSPAPLTSTLNRQGGSSVGTQGTEVFNFIPSWGSINPASQ